MASIDQEAVEALLPSALLEAEADALLPYPLMEFKRSEEEAVEKIVRDVLKSDFAQDLMVKVIRNVLTSHYKSLYTRRSVWKSELKNVNENQDDIWKLPLSRKAKAYARRKGMKALKNQPKQYQAVNAELTNPGKADKFQNYTVGQVQEIK